MVENKSSSLHISRKIGSGSVFILILCFAILPSSALNVDGAEENIEMESSSPGKVDNVTFSPVTNVSISQEELNNFNMTEHRGFLHGFVESFSVILVSEIGDKTFFIAAIMAMRNNKLNVFLAAISALAVMTILSALLGFVVTTFIPREYTYYTCTAIMFLFGVKMLWEAWRMKDDEGEQTQREVEEELARNGSTPSLSARPSGDCERSEELQAMGGETDDADTIQEREQNQTRHKTIHQRVKEKSWFGKKCIKIFKVFTNTFTMTFLAEWGDRSQLATIVMAGINDVGGVCLGGVLGHSICTGLAVICGALIAKKISVRTVTLIGAVVFIGFAVASLFVDPYEENHLVPDVEGDDHNSTIFRDNKIEFVVTSTTTELSME